MSSQPAKTLLLRNVRPMGGRATDVLIRDGCFAAFGPEVRAEAADSVEDGRGALLIPGLVEAHTHLDKTMLGMPWRPHSAGPTVKDRIDNERRLRQELDIDPERQSARQVLLSVANGTTHIRSHVDIDTKHGLWGIEGVLRTRERFKDLVDIELVAFPQSGLLVRPGTVALMEDALRLGIEVVGGLDPCSIDRDPKGHLDTVFGLAERFGRPVDIHLHEPDALGLFSLDLIVERTRALGMAGRVTVSHAFCLGTNDWVAVGAVLETLAASGIALMTTGPSGWPAPPLQRAIAAGVVVCSGSDGVRDLWHPYGTADMLDRARLVGERNACDTDEDLLLALAACSTGGAQVMGLAGYGIGVGDQADAVLVEAETVPEAIVRCPPRHLVLKRGAVVARDGAVVADARA